MFSFNIYVNIRVLQGSLIVVYAKLVCTYKSEFCVLITKGINILSVLISLKQKNKTAFYDQKTFSTIRLK